MRFLSVRNAVGVVPGTWLLTWVLQVMPLFFFVGGFSNLVSYRSVQRAGGGYRDYLRRRMARLYRPVAVFLAVWAVLGIAVTTWLGWQALDPTRAFPAMLAVLVASCPCALSLALPVVHAAASRRLLDEGILLTQGDALQALNEVDTAVFDKTGTLTRGAPEIAAITVNPQREEYDQALSRCSAKLRNTSPRRLRMAPKIRFLRYFGMNTTWYLQSHFV